MKTYIFLLEIYFILTVLTFLYPKEVQKRNHITNGILMGLFLVLCELILIPNGDDLTFSDLHIQALVNMPNVNSVEDAVRYMPIVKEKFIYSLVLPGVFFIIGRFLYSIDKISINTFDTIFTGLFPFVVYFDFITFIAFKGIGAYMWNYITFFIAYGFVSSARIEFFMFLGIKGILDDHSLKNKV
jgi:hypothetical protein